ncbi:MAG: isoleucine--tRNA ligase [Fervidicoccaceae archaeon]
MSWKLPSNYNHEEIERAVLEYWSREGIRKKVLDAAWNQRKDKPIFAFLEGPPTTNGFMHAGHARGRIYKDAMIRLHILLGHRVWAQGGWDTQGLPVEIEVEKKFGVKSKREIEEKIGVARFIEECKRSVDFYIEEWVKDNERLGIWMDYENAYQTRHPRYLETVWMFLKKAKEAGLLYRDFRVVPRCPRCGTALSNHELSLGSEIVKDPSLYFKVKAEDGEYYFLAWTTTPWTIIANRALAVNPEADYVMVEIKGEKYILAEQLLPSLLSKLKESSARVINRYKGRDLVGKRYRHPLAEEVPANATCSPPNCTVVAADYVVLTEGTGIVHTAPSHGPEDFETGAKYNLQVWTPLRDNGVFGEDSGIFSGLWFKEANRKVVEVLQKKGLVLLLEEVEHEYPHCWRCGTPLIYYPSAQWFFKTTAIVERMRKELSDTLFKPSWGFSRMDSWVSSSRDWCISRERYWGTPLPIWRCEKCGHTEVFGSIKELEEASHRKLEDPHKPTIDEIVLRCPKCNGEMRREPFVADVWADSGVAHTAALRQLGLEEMHEKIYPYSFALEPPEQVRGWFYTLLITSTVLHNRTPYRRLGMHGLILDSQGQKMSKSKGNVVMARDSIRKHGADQLRLFMCYRNSPWQDIRYVDREISEIGSKLRIIYNVFKFLVSYAQLDKWTPQKVSEDLKAATLTDKWILTKLSEVIRTVVESAEDFDLHLASKSLYDFLVEDVSHRYVVAIRRRVWTEEDVPEKRAAYATLYTTLRLALPLMAVFTPYHAEYLYQALAESLGGEKKESIMLETVEDVSEELKDVRARVLIDAAFKAVDSILAYRASKGMRRRMPIKRAAILLIEKVSENEAKELSELISSMANVTKVEVLEKKPEKFVSELSIGEDAGNVYVLEEADEETLLLGYAKEIVRRIQLMRKDAKLNYDDFIKVEISTASELLRKAINEHGKFIMNETRAVELKLGDARGGREFEIDEEKVAIQIVKI